MTDKATDKTIAQFREYTKRMKYLGEATGVIYWDMRTGAPKKGIPQRSEVVGALEGDLFRMSVSDEMGGHLDALSAPQTYEQLDKVTRASVRECRRDYERSKKIPPERYQEYATLCARSESAWEEAKEQDDFDSFRPYLEKIVSTLKEFTELWGYEEAPYDALLDQYEPGMTVKKIDAIFAPLRERTVALVKRIGEAAPPDDSFLTLEYDKGSQREFCEYMLRQMGYDFAAGRLDESVHPFAIGLSPGDVRVTTRFNTRDLQTGLFGTIHEGGHALYEQNISPELSDTLLATGASMGIHESQSRFWENMIGRSEDLWGKYLDELRRRFPSQLGQVSVEDFYRAINLVKPSLIRIDADELTYNLHIMVRYEIEKGLFNGEFAVADLPSIWSQKMQDYLGVRPTSNATGVLQDVHWSGGMFGYFPSYTLGNIYAAQLEHQLREDVADYRQQIRRGDLSQVRQWLTEKVHRHGKALTPGEIMLAATGEELNSKYLIEYLEQKFSKVYGLSR